MEQDDGSSRITDAQMQMAYDAIVQKELDKTEIDDLAKQFGESDAFGRSYGSATFLLPRMHILVHGVAPHGETESRAEKMFGIPQRMIDFANRKGLDTLYNMEAAWEELRNRPVRVKREEAKQIMANYYRANKAALPKNIGQRREEIIDRLMNGATPEEAFSF
jgi:hypothetical protein